MKKIGFYSKNLLYDLLSCFPNSAKRGYAILTSDDVFRKINFSDKKIIEIAPNTIKTSLPVSAEWDPPSRIEMIPIQSLHQTSEATSRYYFGGLPALMQAVRKLEELKANKSSDKVIYVNDGKIPKTMQSGHQGHVHPSEWASEDCSMKNLFKVFFKGLGIVKEDDPADLENYSYLHFPINFKDIVKNPINYLGLYLKFFNHRILHTLKSKKGVSNHDIWLCESVRKSLSYHEELSKKIEDVTGEPTFKRAFRVYWSSNQEQIKKKKETWEALGIQVEYMTDPKEIKKYTLAKDTSLYILKIYGDGKFYPNSIERISAYLKKVYPNFIERKATVTSITVEEGKGKPLLVCEKDSISKIETLTVAKSVFGSPGHDQVVRLDPLSNRWNQMWKEVPVSGVSSTWTCEIDIETILNRLGLQHNHWLKDEQIKAGIKELVPMANLSNLHVTVFDCQIKENKIELLVRASQGANFNSSVAFKGDLMNMRHNLERYFVGDWTLCSVGTCTRKTCVINVPEVVEMSKGSDSVFLHGLSGIGYSFTGVSFKDLIKPKL